MRAALAPRLVRDRHPEHVDSLVDMLPARLGQRGIRATLRRRTFTDSGLDSIHVGPIRSDAVPDFSLADVAIVLGAATLVVELLATEMAGRAAERPRR